MDIATPVIPAAPVERRLTRLVQLWDERADEASTLEGAAAYRNCALLLSDAISQVPVLPRNRDGD